MKNRVKIFLQYLIVLCLLPAIQCTFTLSFPNGTVYSDPYTLTPNVAYTMNITFPSNDITAGSTVDVQFGYRYNIVPATLSGCQYSIGAGAYQAGTCSVVSTGSGTATSYLLTFSNIYPTTATAQTSLNLKFTITNPWGGGSGAAQNILVYINDQSSTVLGTGQTTIQFWPSVMTSCSYSSSSFVTGANSSKTLSFTPTVPLIAGSTLQVTLPLWFGTISNAGTSYTCTGVTNSDSPSLTCSKQTFTSSSTEVFTLSGFVTTGKTINSAVVLQISPLRNPWSTYPFGPVQYQLVNSGVVTQNCTGFTLSMTTANTFTSVTFTLPTSPAISTTYNNLMLRVQIREPFPSSGFLRINFPNTVGFTFTGTAVVTSQNTTEMLLSNVAGSDLTSTFSFINLFNSFSVITPPNTRSFDITFTSLFESSGIYYDIDSSTVTITPGTGILTGLSVNAASTIVNDQTTYSIGFTTANILIVGSYIGVTFPSTVSLSMSGNCSSNINVLSCAIVNNNYVNFTVSGVLAANTDVVLTFAPVTNPNQAITTASFQIITYYDSGLDSKVDSATTGLTITATARPLSNVTITPASFVTYALTEYAFAADMLDPIPSGGSIHIIFPLAITLTSISLKSASFITTSCAVSVSNSTVSLNSCFGSGLAVGTLSFVLDGINNPPSLEPTTSFSIQTAGPSGSVKYVNSGLIITMITPATSTSFAISPTSLTVHASTSYTLSFTFSVPHQNGDYFSFSIDPSMAFVTPSCTAVSGISSVSCATSNSTTLVITLLAVPQASAQISISSIKNYDVSGIAIAFKADFFNAAGYAMQSTNTVTQIYTQDAITVFSINNNDQIALNQNSNFTLQISSPFAIHNTFAINGTQLVVTIPTEFSVGGSTSCATTSGTCGNTGGIFTISPVGLGLTNFTVILNNILLPFFSISSTSFAVAFRYNGKDIASVSTGITVSPFCTSPCQRCQVVQTTCESCLPAPNTEIYLYTINASCLNGCPAQYYGDLTNICQNCVAPCFQCLDSVNCTKCVADTWLYQTACVTICPDTFFNDSSGVCLSCVGPCVNCQTLTQCTSCQPGFFYTSLSCVANTSCPSGTFANTSSLQCDPCTAPCATCDYFSDTSCQTCTLGFVSFNSSCLINCPDTYFNDTGICSSCVPPCGKCTTLTFCTSCVTNFLDAPTGQCVTSASCPAGTYPNATTLECATCPVGCTACSSSTQCSACDTTIYVFYNFQCLTSCPTGTYQAGLTCQNCAGNCQSCTTTATTCTSCSSPEVLHNNQCQSNCPGGYFNNTGTCDTCNVVCQSCSSGSSCDSCTNNLYLNGGQCVAVCPTGTYQDTFTQTCVSCSGNCSSCIGSANNCSSCPTGSLLYNGGCTFTCPGNYFNISGQCLTCGNCVTCTSFTTCSQCITGYFMFNGICYTSCPPQGIADPVTFTCTPCDISCLTCSGTTTSCTSCKGGTYLYTGSCFTTCPAGLLPDAETNSCTTSSLGSLIFFPCSITFLLWIFVLIYSKCNYSKTQMVTSIAGGLALILWFSWLILIFTAGTNDLVLTDGQKSTIMGVGLTGVICSLILGVIFACWIRKNFQFDSGFDHWKDRNNYNMYSYRIIMFFTCLTLPFFRMIYSRIFLRNNFSSFFLNGGQLFLGTNWFTAGFMLFCILPVIFCCGFLIYLKQTFDQTLIYSIDTLILSLLLILFLVIDMASKDEHYFDEMLQEQPYLKRLKYKNLDGSFSAMRFLDDNNNPIYRSEIGEHQKEDFFRKKVTCVEYINKFGHLNEPPPEPVCPRRRVKSLPNDLSKLPQLDPENDDDDAINSEIWNRELRRKQQLLDEEEAERKRREEEERLRKLREEQEAEQERLRLQMLEDLDQREELQFRDLAAIDKAEGKNAKQNRSMMLSKFKSVESKAIDPKAKKKLQDMSKKNGLDPTFMTQTFGVQKHHNPQLLNSVIDIHNGVKRESVRNLFNPNNDQQVLQAIFAKNSNADPARMKQLFNDPQSAEIIKRLADKEEGIVSPEVASLLLDKNSKFSKQFVKELLSPDNGMDPEKLRKMLKDNPDPAAQEAALKALKKIGGKNLQNKQLLENMLGEDSKLSAQAFVRVANDLPPDVIQKLFGEKSEANDKIIQKLLNNPKVDLKKLAPILSDPAVALQLAQTLGDEKDSDTLNRVVSDLSPEAIATLFGQKSQTNDIIINEILKNKKIDLKAVGHLLKDPELNKLLAKALSHPNPAVRENILNMLKNGEKLDPELLKQMLSDNKLVDKLLTQPVDPAFLSNLLKQGAKTDLKLLKKTLDNMSPAQISQAFGFNPQKNLDMEKMSKLFQANSKSDPKLIAQLLEPELVASLYSKSSTAKAELLNTLVQRGKKINPDEIIKIYGDSKNLDKKYLTDYKYNVTDSNFNLLNKIQEDDSQLGFKKMDNNTMSRTDGVAGFLSPIHVSLARGKGKGKRMPGGSIDDISDEEVTQYNEGEDEEGSSDEQYEIVNGRKIRRKKRRKKLQDVRLDAEPIYLQRLRAPHEMKKEKEKNVRRRKPKNTASMKQLQKMDQENEVYDLDF